MITKKTKKIAVYNDVTSLSDQEMREKINVRKEGGRGGDVEVRVLFPFRAM